MPKRLLAIAPLLSSFVASQSHAQLRGYVVDPSGHPIAGATVALWLANRELVTTLSKSNGAYAIQGDSVAYATGVAVRAIGFRPQVHPWSAADTVVSFTLQPFAAPLADVVTEGLRITCPTHSDPSAHQLWSAVRKRYDITPTDLGLHVRASFLTESADAHQLGSVDEARARLQGPGSAAMHGSIRAAGYAFIRDSGYARVRPVRAGEGIAGDGAYFAWWYPSFHRWQPDHFVREEFGALQHLVLVHRANGLGIRFCSRKRSLPYVAGVLLLGPDSSIVEAAWQFETPKPKEGAGGHAWYLPAEPRSREPSHLLPSVAVFWRQYGGRTGLYYQSAAVYTEWLFRPTPAIEPEQDQ